MTLKCEQTHMHATLSFKDDSKNSVEGGIYRGDVEIGSFQGTTGACICVVVLALICDTQAKLFR